MPQELIQIVLGGVLLGGIYGLAAFGLSISFGVLNLLNLAHGEFLMLGALAGYLACLHITANPFLAALLVAPIFGVIATGYYAVFLRAIAKKEPSEHLTASVLVTLGSALIIEDVTAFFWNQPVTGIPYTLPALEIGGVVVSSVRLLVLAAIATIAIGLQMGLKMTVTGMCVRAVTQNREGALIVGVPIDRISALTFGLGGALAASAGVFYAVLFTASPVMGIPLTVKSLCVVILGGLGSMTGLVCGALTLGVTESITAAYIGPQWSGCVASALLLVTLTVAPRGLWGRSG